MKIIQLCAIDQTMKVFLKPLIKRLMDQGSEVICVCSNGPYTEALRLEGLNIVNISIDRKIKLFSNMKSIFKLYRFFKSERPDELHVHTPIASILARIAAKLAKVPIVIYTAHGFYFHDNMSPMKYKLFLNIEKYMAKYFTDFIFTQSEEDRLTAIKNCFIDKRKIVCIGNDVDVHGKFNPQNINHAEVKRLYKDFKLTEQNIVITFIGRLVSEKGIVELLEAFNNIDNDNVKLLVVGDIDQGCRDLKTKELINSKYKDNRSIIFAGFRGDINNILYTTDIFCLPSYREGMPRTIIEAMAMECAVVATDIRGCREEVVDGKTGFLVKHQSVNDIQRKLEILIKNVGLLDSMKTEGRARTEEYFDEEQVVSKQIDVINRLYKDLKNYVVANEGDI
jgi:glycosyltransferase involved in cell wall biosynthesis